MRRCGAVIVLAVAVLALFPWPSGAQDSWLDSALEGWNTAGAAVPAAPSSSGSDAGICAQFVRPPETNEDAALVAQGWQLRQSYERGWNITLVGGAVGFDAMCRPVYYQQFVFVDGVFAGTLSPQPMVPRSDGTLTDASITAADRVLATYARYLPTDPLCCPSREIQVSFAITRAPEGPVVIPVDGQATATPSGARDAATSGFATTPWCVILGTGGDDLSLVSWSEDEIAAFEAEAPDIQSAPQDPATGTCRDLAGLPVVRDFLGGFSWVCLQTAGGGWYGPQWTAKIYLPRTADPQTADPPKAVPPDPTQGGCPGPRDDSIPQRPESELAASTVVYLSQLDAPNDLDTLYAWLHPDAQAVVPKDAVTEWLSRAPEPIKVTSVDFGEWTWDVTGTTYPNTAEVAYVQPLVECSTDEPDEPCKVRPVPLVVRLVQDDQGLWRWFFER
jgi:hypothetical protein